MTEQNTNIGIGTTTPNAKLDVQSSYANGFGFFSSNAGNNGTGVFDRVTGLEGSGVLGKYDGPNTNSASGWGVFGLSQNGYAGVFGSGGRNGVLGVTSSASDSGVFGENDGSGWGVAAAIALRVHADAQITEPVARYDQQQQRFVPVPIDVGPEGDQVFLILFGTGFRAANGGAAVRATIGGEPSEVLYAGPAVATGRRPAD